MADQSRVDTMEVTLTAGILTRGRLPDLRRAVNSLLATVGMPVEVLVAFDDDITGFQAYEPPAHVSKTLLTPRHYYVRGTNALYKALAVLNPGFDHFLVSNDDVEFIEPNWGPMALTGFTRMWPDDELGLVELLGGDQCAHFVSRRRFVDEHLGGRLANPLYTMYCSDTELLQTCKAAKRYSWLMTRDHPICIHHKVEDALRAEVRHWYGQDATAYNVQATANGWPLVNRLENAIAFARVP